MQIVPFTSDYDQRVTTQLGDDTYVIDAHWNERGQRWTFDLTRNSDQVLLVAGVPLLAGQDVLSPYALGIGGIAVADISNTNSEAGPDDFGDRVIAVYLSPAELALLAGAGVPGISASGVPPAPAPSLPAAGGSSGAGSGGTTTVTTVVSQTVTNLTMVGGGFASDTSKDSGPDDAGAEVLAWQYPVNAGLNPNATLKGVLTTLFSGVGTLRVYLGGSFGTIGATGVPSGTLIGTLVISGAGSNWISGTPVANPGGIIPISVTLQAGAGQTVSAGPFVGAVG